MEVLIGMKFSDGAGVCAGVPDGGSGVIAWIASVLAYDDCAVAWIASVLAYDDCAVAWSCIASLLRICCAVAWNCDDISIV